jgi:hypothetical protein
MFTSRELASLIWIGVVVILIAVAAVRSRDWRANVTSILVLAIKPPISLVLLGFYAYMAALVWLASTIGLWNVDLLKETINWGIISGLALVFSATEANDPAFFKKAMRRTFAATVLIEFFLGIVSFSLPVEILIQPLVLLLVGVEIVAKNDPASAQVASCVSTLLAIFGFAFAAGTALLLWQDRKVIEWDDQLLILAMLVWLPLGALPFLYPLTWGTAYGVLVRMVRWKRDERPVPFSVRTAIVVGFNRHRVDLARARLHPAQELAQTTTFRDALAVVREFRRSLLPAGSSAEPDD